MNELTVITQDPAFGGGATAQTDAFVEAARALDRDPRLLWVPHPALAGRRLTIDRVEPLRQLRGAHRLAAEVRTPVWVVATSATAGYAATLAGVEYDCWLGTTVDDEWLGRRENVDPWRRTAFAAGLPALRRIERRVLQGARRLYATSRGSQAAVAGGSGREVGILPIPVDVDSFTPAAALPQEPVAVFVGRAWDPRKNVGLLLAAWPEVRRRMPGATLRLVGEPPRGPLPAGVEVTGVVPSIADELRNASLFILPSRQEGFGIVAAEALAAGVPVLSTRSGGPEELIEQSGGGRLLDTFDPAELAEAAAELLGDDATLNAMRTAGRAYVEANHSRAHFHRLLSGVI